MTGGGDWGQVLEETLALSTEVSLAELLQADRSPALEQEVRHYKERPATAELLWRGAGAPGSFCCVGDNFTACR